MILALTQAPSPLWYFARAAGLVSLLLLAATVALGLALTLRWRSPSWPTFVSEGLHRYLTTVLFVFLAIHVVTIWLDPFTKLSLVEVLVPFVSSYRPVWMALGICAFELTLALGLSVYIRNWIGYRAWRVAHYFTNLIFPLALVHGIGTGSDTRTWWGLAIYGVSAIPVGALAAARLVGGSAALAPVRETAIS
jgi:predicted ferric reductase